jgi:dihydroorotase
MYDLLIKGGLVIDPAQQLAGVMDVAIAGDKIAAVKENISEAAASEVVAAQGKVVTPGLIDLHTHVYQHVINMSVDPDDAGVRQAVTTVVDAGSAGQAIFNGFKKFVIPKTLTRIFCFLHLGSQGLSLIPELRDWNEIDTDAAAAAVEQNLDVIKGIKLRLVGNTVAAAGVKVVAAAKTVVKRFGLPVMVHIGDDEAKVPANLTREFLPLLEAGDILTHVYTAKHGGILDKNNQVIPEAIAARDRGVVFDVANATTNFSYRVAREAISQGILPTTLSTDLTVNSLTARVYGLTVTMSKFLALGLSLNQVVAMTTANPARALGESTSLGSLKPGMAADISIFQLAEDEWDLENNDGDTLRSNRLIFPRAAVRIGKLVQAAPVAHPYLVKAE